MKTSDLTMLTTEQLMEEKARLERMASYLPARLACPHLKMVAAILKEISRRETNA
jgi:hypothetical protein